MKIDGHPFPVSMISGGSSALINKYQKKRDREERTNQELRFDPHWECPFFIYCWDQGMRLPSVDNCPRCSDRPRRLFREDPEASRSAQQRGPRREHQADHELADRPMTQRPTRVSVHDRLGPLAGNEYHFDQEVNEELQGKADGEQEQKPQWCPTGLFSRSQKRRAQRMRCREIRTEQQRYDDEDDHESPPVRQEWRPKLRSHIHSPTASVNMVFLLPR